MLPWQGSVVAAELKTPAGERSPKACRAIAKALATVAGTQHFSEEARLFMAQKLTTQEFKADEQVFDIGDIGNHLYIVLYGWVSVEVWVGCREGHASYKECPCTDKQLKRVTTLDSGSSFGEIALQPDSCKERSARVSTMERACLIALSREDYNAAKLMCPLKIRNEDILAYLLTVEGGLLANANGEFSERDLLALVPHLVVENYVGREIICREKCEADRMVLVKSGFCMVLRSFGEPHHAQYGCSPAMAHYTPRRVLPTITRNNASTSGKARAPAEYTIDIGLTAVVDSLISGYSNERDESENDTNVQWKPVCAAQANRLKSERRTTVTNSFEMLPCDGSRMTDTTPSRGARNTLSSQLMLTNHPKEMGDLLSVDNATDENTEDGSQDGENTKRRYRLEDILTPDMVIVDNLRQGRTYGLLEIMECTPFKNYVVADPACQIYSIKKLSLLRYVAKGIVHALFCNYKSDLTDECLVERRLQRTRWDKFKNDLLRQINVSRRAGQDKVHTRRGQMPRFVSCAPVLGSTYVAETTSNYISARLGARTMKRVGADGLLWEGKAVTPPRTPYDDMQRQSAPANALDIYAHRAEGKKVEIRLVKPERKLLSMFAMERKIGVSISTTRHFFRKKRMLKAENRRCTRTADEPECENASSGVLDGPTHLDLHSMIQSAPKKNKSRLHSSNP